MPEPLPTTEPRYDSHVLEALRPDPLTLVLCFERPPFFSFAPGQYVWLVLPERSDTAGAVDRRAYSLASATNAETLECVIRVTESAYCQALAQLAAGDALQIIGPFGFSFVPPKVGAIMISGGVGIAPFLSIGRSSPPGAYALYAFFSPGRLLHCRKEVLGWRKRVQVECLEGVPTAATLAGVVDGSEARPVYISGPQPFVTQVAHVLRELGVVEGRLRFESFYPSSAYHDRMWQLFSRLDDSGQVVEKQYLPILKTISALPSGAVAKHQSPGRIPDAFFLTGIGILVAMSGLLYFWSGLLLASLAWMFVACVALLVLEYAHVRYERSLEMQNQNHAAVLPEVEEAMQMAVLFTRAAEQSSNHVIVTDQQGRVMYANKAAEHLTGYSFSEMRGQTPRLWGGLMDLELYTEVWERKKTEKVIVWHEFLNRHKSGRLYTAFGRVSPIHVENTLIGFIATEENITHLKEIDKAKNEFVSLASHQLRTPLSAISWYAEMLLAGDAGPLRKDQKTYISEISLGNKRMIALVNALLNVSRIEMGTFVVEPVPTDIVALVKEVIREVDPLAKTKDINISATYPKKSIHLSVDPQLMHMVIENPLTNAIKYTVPGGRVACRVSQKKNGDVVLEIADNGCGIPEAEQHRIFTKLFRASNVVKMETDGTGLGLYTVKSILDHSGGDISFESKEGVGTTFTVTLPAEGMTRKMGTRELT